MEKKKNVVEEIKKILCGDCKALSTECQLCLKNRQVAGINNLLYQIMTSERNRIKCGIMGLNIDKVIDDMKGDKERQDLLRNVLIWIVSGRPAPGSKDEKNSKENNKNKK